MFLKGELSTIKSKQGIKNNRKSKIKQ